MGKKLSAFVALFLCAFLLHAQEPQGEPAESALAEPAHAEIADLEEFAEGGREIPNLLSAVRAARAGDYILLPSGRRYILTQEEIDIANGRFGFDDLSGVATEERSDGTLVRSISEGHTAFEFPDGQSAHLLRTGRSFSAFMDGYVRPRYFLGYWVDRNGNHHEARLDEPPAFDVFRATVQFQVISDGFDYVTEVEIRAFNHHGESYMMRFFSTDMGWIWGNVRDGGFRPVGETREIDFDIE